MRLYLQFMWLVSVMVMVIAAAVLATSNAPAAAKPEADSVESTIPVSLTLTSLENHSTSALAVKLAYREIFKQTAPAHVLPPPLAFFSPTSPVSDVQQTEQVEAGSPLSTAAAVTSVVTFHLFLPLVTQSTTAPGQSTEPSHPPTAISDPSTEPAHLPTATPEPLPPTPEPPPSPPEPPVDAPGRGRSTVDRPDDVGGYQVHVMYVVPSDGVDRELDLNGALANSVGSFQNWLAGQTGGVRLRLDTYGGQLDITFHRLSQTDAMLASHGAFVRDQVESGIRAAGFNAPNKLYAVYYDGTSNTACGGAAWPPALMGNAAVLYLQGLPNEPMPCSGARFASSPGDSPEYLEFSMLHEIFHTLGAAPTCAARHVLQGHVSDSNTDLMYSGTLPWYPSVLDYGRDDYWGHNNPHCLDLSKSVFLDPLPVDAVKPPGWP